MTTDLVHDTGPRPRGVLASAAALLGGWPFPVFALTLLLGFAAMIVLVVSVPTAESGFGAFAAEFKRWCFDWDGASAMPMGQVAFMVSELLILALAVFLIWRAPLRAALRAKRRGIFMTAAAALVVMSTSLVLLVRLGTPAVAAEPDVHALRTALPTPPLRLVDQDGAVVDIADLRGDVVLVTAVYATCGSTCPMLLGQAKRVVKDLSDTQRQDLHILAITLDPARDTQAVLTEMAWAQGVSAPLWRLLTGPVADVEATLDGWEVARRRNPETGQIDHANLFLLIDRRGKLAFRLSLSAERERWLAEALATLLAEPSPPPLEGPKGSPRPSP